MLLDLEADETRIIRKFRMRIPNLIAKIAVLNTEKDGLTQYRITIIKSVDGLTARVRRKRFAAKSNKHAVYKANTWLREHFPEPKSDKPKQGVMTIEDLFK